MLDSIGFDLDGTIWSTVECITGAWQKLARDWDVHLPDEEQMSSVMGLNRYELMKKLFPDMEKDKADAYFDAATIECVNGLRENGGKLYDGVEETLAELSKHYKLYIVSNCQESYLNAFLSFHKLGKYFCDFAFEDPTTLSKGENIKKVMKRNSLKSSVYIGDTQGDCDAARLAEVPFGYAAYGFGKVDRSDYIFDSFSDILGLINNEK